MRNSRKANVTRKTVMIVLLPLLIWTSSVASAQTLEGPLPVDLPDLESPQVSNSDQLDEDKWALTDEDRMSDEEMDEELFGNGAKKTKSIDRDSVDTQESLNEKGPPPRGEDARAQAKEPSRLAVKQSIESYLRSINSLTIDTYTPPATRLDGVDVPTRLMSPQSAVAVRSSVEATLSFQTPDIYHRPLYFEDQSLERYGIHRCRRQPVESARKFISDTVSLPREMRKQPPGSCVHQEIDRYNQPGLIPANR